MLETRQAFKEGSIVSVKLQNEGGVLTAALGGEIDHHTVKEMREAIDEAIERIRPAVLLLDVRQVGFMDSSGIGLVMGRYRLLHPMGGKIVIVGAAGKLEKIMRIGGLEKIAEFSKEDVK